MITWIRENASLVSFLGSAVLVISGAAVAKYQLSGLVAQQAEVQNHIHDTTRHLDPQRDAEEKRRLIERIEKLEERQERAERRRAWTGEQLRRRGDRR